MPQTSAFARREWETFGDYLDVSDLSLSQVDLDVVVDYLRTRGGQESTTRKRASAVLSGLATHGVPLESIVAPTQSTVFAQAGTRDPRSILEDLPPTGWPHGFPMRRDAALVVVLALLGLSRSQVRRLHPRDFVLVEVVRPGDLAPTLSWVVAGREVPFDSTPATCGQCQLTLWLGLWSAWLDGFRSGVERCLEQQQGWWGHVCDDVESFSGSSWRREPVIFPGIDRHGWPLMETLSERQLSRIVHRLHREPEHLAARRPLPVDQRPVSADFGRRPDPDPDGRIAALLDRLEEATDEVMERMNGVLAAVET